MTDIVNLDEKRALRHAERDAELGVKPFVFAGETFYVRANVGYAGIKRVASLDEDTSGTETFASIETAVLSMLDPRDNAHERFLKVANDPDVELPITFEDLIDLQNWLISESTSRPPTQEEPSVSTPPTTGPALTVA